MYSGLCRHVGDPDEAAGPALAVVSGWAGRQRMDGLCPCVKFCFLGKERGGAPRGRGKERGGAPRGRWIWFGWLCVGIFSIFREF